MSHNNESNGDGYGTQPGKPGDDRRGESSQSPFGPETSSRDRMVGGAKKIAARVQSYYDDTVNPALERSGAKEFYDNRVVPASKNVTQSVQQTVTDQHNRLISTPVSRAAIVLLIVALLGIVITFLPMGPTSFGRYRSTALNVVDGNYEGLGGLVLVQVVGVITAFTAATIFRLLLFMTIVVSIVAIAWRSARVKKMAGIIGVGTGLLGVLIGVVALLVTSNLDNMPVGVGTILLLISSGVVAVTAFVLLRSSRTFPRRPPVPPQVSQST